MERVCQSAVNTFDRETLLVQLKAFPQEDEVMGEDGVFGGLGAAVVVGWLSDGSTVGVVDGTAKQPTALLTRKAVLWLMVVEWCHSNLSQMEFDACGR
ncbi:hypothetical protein E2C01_008345 [Portunus trituberculatus]|uniref:Uncharacterized protein n=1 Tax=Portunus trituberculatus TaxID=210409 RepID=A0A5B7D1I7_PORTR|nr:hypothetical protein [Portunus trituberculatus]